MLREVGKVQEIVKALKGIEGVRVINVSDKVFLAHLGGKIEVKSRVPLKTRDDLSIAYTPGVARVCMAIKENEEKGVYPYMQEKHGGRGDGWDGRLGSRRYRPKGSLTRHGGKSSTVQGVW